LISFVLDPNEAPYTVVVQDCLVLPGLHLMVSHVFVDRYMKWAGLDEPFQVWRWHLDVYPPMGIVPVQYGVYGDAVLRKDRIAEGLEARVIQHEIDHLNGILIVDHQGKLNRKMTLDKWMKKTIQFRRHERKLAA
jgi:hypothetical protein